MEPFAAGFVKGWRRSTTFLAVLAGLKALEIKAEDIPKQFAVTGM